MLTREQIAARAAREVKSGESVRIGASVAEHLRAVLPAGTEQRDDGADIAIVSVREISATGEFVGIDDASNAKRVVAILEQHRDKDGETAIRESCREPVSGKAERVVTSLAVFDVTGDGLVLREVAPGVSAVDVQKESGTPLLAADDLRLIDLS
jgi:3-oxoacid CoA-transferase subunit B